LGEANKKKPVGGKKGKKRFLFLYIIWGHLPNIARGVTLPEERKKECWEEDSREKGVRSVGNIGRGESRGRQKSLNQENHGETLSDRKRGFDLKKKTVSGKRKE